ncbi:MAG: hypothetical protein K6T75_01635 [Acetobacteraceae bacterium]|nr:hypothetical protein [Acetobacteraceae bacterium]
MRVMRGIRALVLGLIVMLCAVAMAKVAPSYAPVECDLAPERQYVVLPDDGCAGFDGNWAGGPDVSDTVTVEVY